MTHALRTREQYGKNTAAEVAIAQQTNNEIALWLSEAPLLDCGDERLDAEFWVKELTISMSHPCNFLATNTSSIFFQMVPLRVVHRGH